RHTEFWARMEEALGPAAELGHHELAGPGPVVRRTAQEALDAGVPPKQVWTAGWRALDLPASQK
ncbi:DUF3046 domain-containing protein, partial [Mesorhizobium sp. WSM4962]|uniref:DUF3046 domain-containing protein n=1 Tax=Mesorhizobium sp. WSM4962 TaxID=3038548 RepID=UPI002416BC6A